MDNSLHVQTPTGLGQAAEDQLLGIWETVDAVIVETMKEGFVVESRPNYTPPVLHPQWMENLTPDRYWMLVAQFSAWKSYAHNLINTLECGIVECDNEMKILAASIRRHVRQQAEAGAFKKPSEDAIKDIVITHPRMVDLEQKKQVIVQKKLLVEPHFERYSRDSRALSRFLEARRQELETAGKGAIGQRREF
jgi:hypothetical protein